MKIKKAILTGGGRATRLYPITTTINKHLLPLAGKPMMFHAIEKVLEAGVEEIFINTNPGEKELQEQVGDGGHWGIKIHFFEQTGGPQGIAHVVKEAQKFIGEDPFIFYLSDNIFLGNLKELGDYFAEQNLDCLLAFATVPDPERFGVPVFDKQGNLIQVLEKPTNPPNHFAQTGVYFYGGGVFFDSFERIERSPRGEYEISDIHSLMLKEGKKVGYKEITGWWKDTGKPEDLLLANKLLLDLMSSDEFISEKNFSPTCSIEGNIHIGTGTMVGENVHLKGPVIIAENCVLKNCTIGPYVTVGSGTHIQGAKIENSIFLENSNIQGAFHISNSLVGKKTTVTKKKSEPLECKFLIGDKTIIEM